MLKWPLCRVSVYPFDDHNPPEFSMMKPFCEDVYRYVETCIVVKAGLRNWTFSAGSGNFSHDLDPSSVSDPDPGGSGLKLPG